MPTPVTNDSTEQGLEPTEDLDNIAVFTPGVWNGENFDAAYMKAMAENYKALCQGPNAEFTPWLNLNHKDDLSYGKVKDFRYVPNDPETGLPTIRVDATNIPQSVANLVRSGQLKQPSIEFLSPKPDATTGKMLGYYDRNGNLINGPVFQCLSLLGNNLPGVRGLPDLPEPTVSKFRDNRGALKTFGAHGGHRTYGARQPMSRQDLLAALQKYGVDTSQITDIVPDSLLQSIVNTIQQLTGNPVANNGGADNPVITQADKGGKCMSDANSGNPDPADVSATAGLDLKKIMDDVIGQTSNVPTTGTNQPQPSSIMMKFNDAVAASVRAQLTPILTAQNKAFAAIGAQSQALARHQSEQLAKIKSEVISRFFDRMGGGNGGTNQITPAMQPALRAILEKCDHASVRKFSTGTKAGTELEERMAEMESSFPRQRNEGAKMTQRAPDNPNNPANNGSSIETILAGNPVAARALQKYRAAQTTAKN